MLDEIKQAIEKNLPTQVGKVLQENLLAGEKYKKDFEDLLNKYNILNTTFKKVSDELLLLQQLNLRKQSIDQLEIDYKIKCLTHELDVQKIVNMQHINFITLVVKNPVYTQTGTIPLAVSGMNGNSGFVQNSSFHNNSEISK